jgi:hypothetical protein
MTDTFDSVQGQTFGPQDVAIDKIDLLATNGKVYELKKLMIEMSYFEDIYSFGTSGYVMLRDGVGVIENLRLTGQEKIQISFGKVSSSTGNNTHTFKVYTVGKRKPTGTLTSESMCLYFCSEELLLNEQIKVGKSYPGTSVVDIITDILKNDLKVDDSRLVKMEDTYGTYDFLVPVMKPLEAISWLSTYARPAASGTVGADMLFFENAEGFNFRSINSMMQQKPYRIYKYQQNNLAPQTFQQKLQSVLQYEVTKTYDHVKDTKMGTFANRTITIDPLTRSYKVTDFDYQKDILAKSELKSLNGNGVLVDTPNRLGLRANQNYEASIKVLFANPTANQSAYIKDAEGSVAKDIYADTFVPYRTAQIALANYNTAKIMVPGDPFITAGSVIEFNVYTMLASEARELDKFASGRYLVSAVRHILQSEGAFQTVLEIAKDSTKEPYDKVITG